MSEEYVREITLLYVEDDESIRSVLARRLEKKVKTLYVANDGKEGLELYKKHQPDMILTDVTMPKMDGIEMSKHIRQNDELIPIIIVSAHGESKFLLEAIECGVSSYLLKPIEKEKLFFMLEEHAKKICLERITKEQQYFIEKQKSMLQNILDADKSMSFVTDFNNIMFANKSFLDYFKLDNIESFQEKHNQILDIFQPKEDYLHKNMISSYDTLSQSERAASFFNLVENTDETKRVVLMIDSSFSIRSFYISISMIEEGLYLINLTDITKMTIEKVDTQKKAYTDKLTGLYNRNKLVEFFDTEVERVKRYNHAMSIAILDIDHFKSFNDTHGHLIGDEVLVMIAQSLLQNIRTTDMVARWGGEEFVIVFVETDEPNAVNTSNMLREKIEMLDHKVAGKITVSFGVTQYKANDTLESLFERCDKALYQAKENGRNQVVSL